MADQGATQAIGRCHCRRVRFVAGYPSRFGWHCHCESCRRSPRAGMVTSIGFKSEPTSVDAATDHRVAYESAPGTRRGFCRVCGTTRVFQSGRWGGETRIALAAIAPPVDHPPAGHFRFEEHLARLPWPEQSAAP